jgi:hypothetical protein
MAGSASAGNSNDWLSSQAYQNMMKSMGYTFTPNASGGGTYSQAGGSSGTGSSGTNGSSTGSLGSAFGDLSSTYKDLSSLQFNQTKDLMGLSNQFRTKEGATQGQVDDQAYKRLDAQLQTEKYMSTNVRDQDAARAQAALRNSGSMM